MLWFIIGFWVCIMGVFRLLNFVAVRQMEQDIAFILAESTMIEHSPMPPMSQVSIKVVDRAEIIPAISDECFGEAST
jgi:glycine cleavage system regulatory protein